jgi:alginate O-acetyltransferase complex protein AlgI
LVVLIGWVFFRADNLTQSIQYLSTMFSFSNGEISRTTYLNFFYLNSEYLVVAIVAMLWSTPTLERTFELLTRKGSTKPAVKWIELTLLFMLFVFAASYVAADTYNPFIYFRF